MMPSVLPVIRKLLTVATIPHKSNSSLNHVSVIEINYHLKLLAKAGKLFDARDLFDKMPKRDQISWTNIIAAYVSSSDTTEALSLFCKMWIEPGMHMDPFVLSLAVKACGLNVNVNLGELLHGYSVKSNFISSIFVGSAILDMYMKVGKIEHGCQVFYEMPMRNVVTWTSTITGLVHAGHNKYALLYFSEMWRSKVACDSHTYAIVLKACADSGTLKRGKEIHCQTVKKGFNSNSFVVNTLATMYVRCGKLDYHSRLFRIGSMDVRDVVSWTVNIVTCAQTGDEERGIELFRRMREMEVSPSEITFVSVISACANIGRIEWGEQLHAHVLRLGLVASLSLANSLISLYSKCGKLTLASDLLGGLHRRDIVSWSTIITGYSQGGFAEEAFEHLSWMRKQGIGPNEFPLTSLLSVSGNMANLELGKELHGLIILVGLDQIEMVRSALINMYSKCGSIKEATEVFREAENDDQQLSSSAMICGYAEHGYGEEAIDLFEKFCKAGCIPDRVTFIGVLMACGFSGQVDVGFHYFTSMSKDYHISPSIEHYGCMVDLLCQAGRLSEAEEMIENMPFQQDDVIWSTVLRACKTHGAVDCGRRAAEKILHFVPNCSGALVTLANIYAANGWWEEVANIRKTMRVKGMIKEPGWSWINVKDQVSAFVSGDHSHPEDEHIHSILDLLASWEEISLMEMNDILNDIG